MGVDYSAKFGIGVRVIIPESEEDRYSYMDNLISDTKYKWFQEGDEDYGGEPNWFYIIIDKPFADGFCELGNKAEELVNFLKSNNIEFEGQVDLVGGLYIW